MGVVHLPVSICMWLSCCSSDQQVFVCVVVCEAGSATVVWVCAAVVGIKKAPKVMFLLHGTGSNSRWLLLF